MHNERKSTKTISLYPLKFKEVIADVLKVKPEPKRKRRSRTVQSRAAKLHKKASRQVAAGGDYGSLVLR
jgi:hypothetical protein